MLLKLQQKMDEATSKLQASGSSASASPGLHNVPLQMQQLLMKTPNAHHPSTATSQIHDELDKVFAPEEVGHKCDLCQRDLASDPERPGSQLRRLEEACVLACGHVYHFKCLRGTTPDLDNRSSNPPCIFCISSSN
ncbi:unnamed protein product [Thlaspi arvense]|uniref:RING-type domain-containing protein n=1 Tax=Thlaspi arvense TaxID=13288 RepID=A0AAU9SRA8_THLAR|nr:unnamed protein product [Thlaspi arvense]